MYKPEPKRLDKFAQIPNHKGHTNQVQSEKPREVRRETKEEGKGNSVVKL